jgi:acyl carrier protein
MVTVEKIVEVVSSAGVVDDMSKFDPNKSFKENGIDSLDVFTVFLAVEDQLGVKLSEEESIGVKSALDIVALVNSR